MYESMNYLQKLQNLSALIAGTEAAKNAKRDITKSKTYTRYLGGFLVPSEFQINAAPGNYNAVRDGMQHCFWFWLSEADPDSPTKKMCVYSGAVYMGRGEAYICPRSDQKAVKFLMESGNLFQHFAESYFLYTLGGDNRYSDGNYPELQDFFNDVFPQRRDWEKNNGGRK